VTEHKFRKKRNIGEYERAGFISEQEAEEMIVLASRLRQMVRDWLKQNDPTLIKG